MRDLVCLKCKKEQDVILETSSRAIVKCRYCGAKLRARTNKDGKLSMEEMAEDIAISSLVPKVKPSGG